MITKLALRNFRSISESGIEFDLKSLTVLMVPNISGKSSILKGRGGNPVLSIHKNLLSNHVLMLQNLYFKKNF